MNKIFVILTALFLSACATKPTQLDVPAKIKHQNKTYRLTTGQDLGTVARYVYVSKPDTLAKWKSQIELLLDRNAQHRSIKDRIILRERIYRNTGVKTFKLMSIKNSQTKKDEGLRGYVVYAPSESNPSWQVNVMLGKEISGCGFVQFQYSQQVKNNQRLNEKKILQHLQKYLIAKEMKTLDQMVWQWRCQNSE
ncbi:hypothetical protein [Rodentibacter haemolyticus]|uniref:ATPases of ABC transporters with duplicated ATPase domains-containing protein n=1 Tax=Rodentibacter haemolyticus TaxID=2778911 RepID=A0ABX6UVR9_9PAST|nr:hypothetical protein [Rodentibacter haemolyticus]QPB41824.1 hypothetical protein IHV77_07745 [Rodentibacter haemolyticus]